MPPIDVPSSTNLRIVVFTCGELGRVVAEELRTLSGIGQVVVVTTPYRVRPRAGFEKLSHILRYEGALGLAKGVASRGLRELRKYAPTNAPTRTAGGSDDFYFDDFHSTECLAAVSALAPDLGVVVGTYILKPAIFEIPRMGSINLHTGKAPQYRGSAPAFWEMFNGEKRVGITVHRVATDVDAGAILRQELFPFDPAPHGNPFDYISRYRESVLHPNGIRLVKEAVADIVGGRTREVLQDVTNSSVYRLPTHRQKRELLRRVKDRRRTGFKRTLKSIVGWVLFRSGLYRRMIKQRAFITLFHRVNDRYAGNPISCTTEEFDRYCRFFSRYFEVVSASSLADVVERGEDLSGKLVITFDDGYADNLAAAEVMRRHGLTGCFFIATDFVGTDRDGWWDIEQGCKSEWMSWDDIRQLSAWGFELGGHTQTHVDLGVTQGVDAESEIAGSKRVLETELSSPISHFAYPFGGRERITPGNLRIIESAGFRTCMSAYGGIVTQESSLLDLQRVAISPWHRSPWQLGFELLREPRTPDLITGVPQMGRSEMAATTICIP